MFCLDFNNVAIQPGVDVDESNVRICLPYMNIGLYIGDETPFTWPPNVLRNAADGAPLLTPDGQPLLIAG